MDRSDIDFRRITLSNSAFVGRELHDLRMEERFDAVVSRVRRGDIDIIATPDLILQSGDRLVRTQLVRPRDEPVALNYLMRDFGGAWRVVDVYLSGTVSELASRRAEFTTLLREGGAARLEAELRRRTETLLRG